MFLTLRFSASSPDPASVAAAQVVGGPEGGDALPAQARQEADVAVPLPVVPRHEPLQLLMHPVHRLPGDMPVPAVGEGVLPGLGGGRIGIDASRPDHFQ